MKKGMAVALAAVLAFSLTACSGAGQTETTAASAPAAEVSSAEDTAAAEETAATEAAETENAKGGDSSAEGAITSSADLAGDQLATEYEQNEGSTVERYNKGADAIQALKQGKIDCVIIDGNPAKAFVDKNDDLMILDEELSSEEYAMCVNKDNAELTEEINGALAELKEDGTLDSIIANYIGDEVGQHPYTSPEGVDRSKGTLVMATNAAFEPYEYYESQEIVGIDPDIAQAVCDILGYELKIEDMEFDAIVNAVVSGKADFGAAGMTVTEDRLLSVDFTDTYTTSSQVIIVKK